MKILIVEEDRLAGAVLAGVLQQASFDTECCDGIPDTLRMARERRYAAILLDADRTDCDGLATLRALRSANPATPTVVITACDDVDRRVAAFELGADDYLVKPFENKELVARVRAAVRRRVGLAAQTLGDGPIALDMASRRLTYCGRCARVTARECELLVALLETPGAILSREQLEARLYGDGAPIKSNAVDALVYTVRQKFGSTLIRNVRGIGWTVGSI
jgi:two-component system OmpR family response regulator